MKIAKCVICGVDIKYVTKPPKKCQACKEADKAVKNARKSRKSKRNSSKEVQMFKVLEELLPSQYYIRNGYYSFLMSPKNAPMQLDIYYPELRLACE